MTYPNSPGWKALGPSRDAAKAVTGHAKTVRDRVHLFLVDELPPWQPMSCGRPTARL